MKEVEECTRVRVWGGMIVMFLGMRLMMGDVFASSALPQPCRELLRDAVRARSEGRRVESVTARELMAEYKDLRSNGNDYLPLPGVDGQRLINEADWARAKATESFENEPWMIYSGKTIDDWLAAEKWVNSRPLDQLVDSDLLKEIHRRAMAHHFFTGAENRRILKQGREVGRTVEESLVMTRRVAQEEVSAMALDHAQFRGSFRTESVDQLPHRGSLTLADEGRRFTPIELQRVREHPYMSVDESSVKIESGGKLIRATARYLAPEHVEAAVAETLTVLQAELKQSQSPEDVIRATQRMVRKMVGIHPFQDGNGRTIRLLADSVYRKHGLPPPLYPNEWDLEMSDSEAVAYALKGMRDYIQSKSAAR